MNKISKKNKKANESYYKINENTQKLQDKNKLFENKINFSLIFLI